MRPVWMAATGMERGHEAAPIVNDGVMFVATCVIYSRAAGTPLRRLFTVSPGRRATA